jgi:hypothetical protein
VPSQPEGLKDREQRARTFAEQGHEIFGINYEWRVPFDGIKFAAAFAESEVARARQEWAEFDAQMVGEAMNDATDEARRKVARELKEMERERDEARLHLAQFGPGYVDATDRWNAMVQQLDAALADAARLREALLEGSVIDDDGQPCWDPRQPSFKDTGKWKALPNGHSRRCVRLRAALASTDATDWLQQRLKQERERLLNDPQLIEALADLEHEQWRRWSRAVSSEVHDSRRARWRRFDVPYAQLDEAAKEQDREWARKSLAAIRALDGDKP